LWGALWEGVRVGDIAPRDYIATVEKLLPSESDESLAQSIFARTATALHRYVSPAARQQLAPALEKVALARMLHADDPNLRIISFRGLRALAETPAGRAVLKDLLAGKLRVEGLELRPLDRWNMVAALIALG